MQQVTPKIFVLAQTKINEEGLQDYLNNMHVPEWTTDAVSDAEKLIEVAGKACYQSFSTDLNKNLTKVGGRNNHDYIQAGIVGMKHGSVLEHASVTMALVDVSRVLTHELVRHRVGTAYSQESGRYVRTDVIKMYIPMEISENSALLHEFLDTVEMIEMQYKKLEALSGVDTMSDFGKKKRLTSALRRILPEGRANSIIVTMNHRTIRHLIELRTSVHAEVEIREAFAQLYSIIRPVFPAIYGDGVVSFPPDDPHDIPVITFASEKV